MSQVIKHTTKLWERKKESESYWLFWCPACGHGHSFHVPRWSFNNQPNNPTFTPSLRMFCTNSETKQDITTCHLNITEGKIIYHGDNPINSTVKRLKCRIYLLIMDFNNV